jgi:hypothetical protein
MPNIFKSLVVRRFLAHSLEIGTTFALTLILLNILNYLNGFMLGYGNFIEIMSTNTPNLGVYNSSTFTDQSLTKINQLIMGFALFYFIYAAFNFFFTFSFLYPKNDFQANFFQRLFGFKKFDFGKKKMPHLEKALRMLLRETVLFFSIYGFFMVLSILKLRDLFDLFNYLTQSDYSLVSIFASLTALFTIFVLPAVLLSIFSLRISKGKQLFWDWASSVTLK